MDEMALTPYEDASNDYLIDRPDNAFMSAQIANGNTMMQTKTSYTTAVTVQKERDLATVQKKILIEAQLMGEAAYYGWGAGKDRVEGPSQALAYALARNWSNCALDMTPIQETPEAWVFTAVFIDLETGFTLPRQFRQSRKSIIYGKFDEERKEAMRFAIGQSKSQRNVILKAIPKWITDQAIAEAKKGCRKKLDAYIKQNGIAAAVEMCVRALAKQGVKETQICEKFSVAKTSGLTVDDLVVIRGDISALEQGQETAITLYPMPDNRDQVKGMLDSANKGNGKKEEPPKTPDDKSLPEQTPTPEEVAKVEAGEPVNGPKEEPKDRPPSAAAGTGTPAATDAAPADDAVAALKADLDAKISGKSAREALPMLARFSKDIDAMREGGKLTVDQHMALYNYQFGIRQGYGKK